jgi:hypothetical protein
MGLGRRKAGQQPAVDQEPPDLLEGHPTDELFDIDASISQRAAGSVGLGDLGGKRHDALEPGLNFRRRSHRL